MHMLHICAQILNGLLRCFIAVAHRVVNVPKRCNIITCKHIQYVTQTVRIGIRSYRFKQKRNACIVRIPIRSSDTLNHRMVIGILIGGSFARTKTNIRAFENLCKSNVFFNFCHILFDFTFIGNITGGIQTRNH